MVQHPHHLAAVTPLIVVPGNELHEVVVQHQAGALVEDAGAGVADEVCRHHLVLGVADDALHVGLTGVANLIADLGVAGGTGESGGQVHHRHIGGGHPEGHTRHLPLQGGDDPAHGLGCAGGGGNDIVEDGATGAPVAAAAGVHSLLLGGGGVDGGHEALLNAKDLVDHIGQGSQAVGGAAGVGNHLHVRAIELAVNAVNKGGGHLVLGRSGEKHALGAALEVAGGLLGGVVGTGALQDVLRPALGPGNHGGVVLAEHTDLVAVHHQIAVQVLHRALKIAEYGVVFQQVNHVVDIGLAQVDAAHIELLRILHQNAQDHPADTAKTIDTNFNRHSKSTFLHPQDLPPTEAFSSKIIISCPRHLSCAIFKNH